MENPHLKGICEHGIFFATAIALPNSELAHNLCLSMFWDSPIFSIASNRADTIKVALLLSRYKLTMKGHRMDPKKIATGALIEMFGVVANGNRIRTANRFLAYIRTLGIWLGDDKNLASIGIPGRKEEKEITEKSSRAECVDFIVSVAARLRDSMTPLVALSYVLIAFIKTTRKSDEFREKMERAINIEHQAGVRFELDVIKLYNTLTEKEIKESVARLWSEIVPDSCIRLQSTVLQAAKTRIGVFITIGKAMREHPDFDWQLIGRLFENEMRNFSEALDVVRGNPFFGFRHDLGVAKPSRFTSLGFVCRELLAVSGDGSGLYNYQGWPRNVRCREKINKLVKEYVTHKTERGHGALGELGAKVYDANNDILFN